MLLVAGDDDHEAVERRAVAQNGVVVVAAEAVARPVLQQMQPCLVHSQPQHARPVRSEGLLIEQKHTNEKTVKIRAKNKISWQNTD